MEVSEFDFLLDTVWGGGYSRHSSLTKGKKKSGERKVSVLREDANNPHLNPLPQGERKRDPLHAARVRCAIEVALVEI
jgi:hypothetical protein